MLPARMHNKRPFSETSKLLGRGVILRSGKEAGTSPRMLAKGLSQRLLSSEDACKYAQLRTDMRVACENRDYDDATESENKYDVSDCFSTESSQISRHIAESLCFQKVRDITVQPTRKKTSACQCSADTALAEAKGPMSNSKCQVAQVDLSLANEPLCLLNHYHSSS